VADPAITRAMVALMDMNAVIGGAASHYGGPAALAELNSALYGVVFQESCDDNKPWHDLFHLINDAGHTENGLYALKANYGFADLTLDKLKKFRSIESPLTGHGESHLFPEGVYLSNGPLGSSLPQAQGLAMADALSGHARVTVATISDGACMEGEAKESLAALPGFAAKGQLAPFVLIISDNDTKLTGRISKDAFNMQPTFASLAELGWKVIHLTDGHNLQECVDAIETAIRQARDNPKVPIAIHARTIKGKGVQKTEASASGGHGFPLKEGKEARAFVSEILVGHTIPPEIETWIAELEAPVTKSPSSGSGGAKTEKIQTGVSQALIKARQKGFPVVSITSDLPGSTGVAEFRKAFPEASFDVGVAEANMVSVGSGFSKQGYIPVVDTFAQFGVTKGALPLIMGALSSAPVIAIFSHTGFQDAADGASHQALSYFAMTASIPHTQVIALTCSEEAEALVFQAVEQFAQDIQQGRTPKHTIFFLGRENFPANYGDGKVRYELGRAHIVQQPGAPDWQSVRSEKSLVLAVAGSLLPEALAAQTQLQQQGIMAIVVNPSTINHPDVDTFAAALAKTQGRILTIEDHQLTGGFGAQLLHALAQAQISFKAHSLGVHDEFGRSAYTSKDLYRLHGLDSAHIAKAAAELVLRG
jgi:transketolase